MPSRCVRRCILPRILIFCILFSFDNFFWEYFSAIFSFRLNISCFIVMHSPRYDLWIIIALKIFHNIFCWTIKKFIREIRAVKYERCMFIKYDNYIHFSERRENFWANLHFRWWMDVSHELQIFNCFIRSSSEFERKSHIKIYSVSKALKIFTF